MKLEDTAEVIEITNSSYPMLYKNGSWGVIECEFSDGNCAAIIGNTVDDFSSWHVPNGNYRKVGRLTVKELKHE